MNNLEFIEYRINSASLQDIFNHLIACKDSFIPPLDQKVKLTDYSSKIKSKATCFEAWHCEKLIGLVAEYFNDVNERKGFITNVSTLPNYNRRGIAHNLIQQCIDYSIINDFSCIDLEVNKSSEAAIHLYEQFNFKIVSVSDDFYKMTLNLKD